MLEAGDAFVGDAEDLEEGNQEGLGLGILVAGVGPMPGEGEGARFDFVPGEGYAGIPLCRFAGMLTDGMHACPAGAGSGLGCGLPGLFSRAP
jgi:hypothetical protein